MVTEASVGKGKVLGSRVFCRAERGIGEMRKRAIRSKNVDMSNEKEGEKPNGRKSKGSNRERNVSWVKRSLIES